MTRNGGSVSIVSLLQTQGRVVVDLTHVRYVSSTGYRALIRRGLRGRDPRVKRAGMSLTVREDSDPLGLQDVIEVHATAAEAVESFGTIAPPLRRDR